MEFEHTLDAKGRMNFPAKLRDTFGDLFYISKSLNGKCLAVYTQEGWNKLKEQLASKPSSKALPIERFVFGSVCEVEPDKQGRIAIPASLRSYAGITTEVTVVGLNGRAEIWDKTAWADYTNALSVEDLQASLEEMEI